MRPLPLAISFLLTAIAIASLTREIWDTEERVLRLQRLVVRALSQPLPAR